MPSPTSSASPPEPAVIRALRTSAREAPDTLALDGERRMTRAGLLAAAEACAAEIAALGRPLVAWQLDEDWRWIVLDLACLLAGVIALPLPRFFTRRQRDGALTAAGCDLIILAPGAGDPGDRGRRIPIASLGTDALARPDTAACPAAIPDGTAKITFTSGSTGSPRGVCLARSLLDRVVLSLVARLGPSGRSRHLAVLPLAILLENVGGLYRCLLSGGCYVLPAPDVRAVDGSSAFDAARLALAIERHGGDVLIVMPGMLEAMTTEPARAAFRRPGFVAVGGAPLPRHVLAAARAEGIAAYEGYGLSECGSVVALNVPGDDRPGTVGRPLPHVRVTSRDGELVVAGAVFRGYLGAPTCGQGPVATGDIGYRGADGRIVLEGRRDNRIVTPMGRNVSPESIETLLARVLPGVPDLRAGRGGGPDGGRRRRIGVRGLHRPGPGPGQRGAAGLRPTAPMGPGAGAVDGRERLPDHQRPPAPRRRARALRGHPAPIRAGHAHSTAGRPFRHVQPGGGRIVKTVLITGASGGIGSATARGLAAAGHRLVLTGRDRERLEATAKGCGGNPRCVAADLTRAADRRRVVDACRETGVDTVVNNAGINELALFEQMDDAAVAAMVEANVTAPMTLTRALIPLLRERPAARIVNVGSTFGTIGFPGYVAYSATKFALRGFSEALARELAHSRIAIHYVAPRTTRTGLSSGRANALNEALGNAVDNPDSVARSLCKILDRPPSQRYLGWPEKLFARLNLIAPRLVSRALRSQLGTIRRYADNRYESWRAATTDRFAER